MVCGYYATARHATPHTEHEGRRERYSPETTGHDMSCPYALVKHKAFHQYRMASSKRRARSSAVAWRGDSFVTRCCGSVPATSAGMSAVV